MWLNDLKSKNFDFIVDAYIDNIDPNQSFDVINSLVISNLKYISEAFLFLLEYLDDDKQENVVLQSQRQQTFTVRKQIRESVDQLIQDLPQQERNRIQQLIPSITNNVKNQLIKHKPLTPSQLRKNKLFRIQTQLAISVNDLNYDYEPFCLFKLIEIVVILYKFLANIENYIDDNSLFLNHDQNVQVSSSMKEKFNKIALNDNQRPSQTHIQTPKQKRQQLVDNISRFVVTNLKQNNFKMV